jgi:hypothetical protein
VTFSLDGDENIDELSGDVSGIGVGVAGDTSGGGLEQK